ncbi:diacylglycerol kinase [Sphingomonas piscis]|uniref:Diacylglycerol kinase n=1 Tax=Sphingomonas piscis TaxID=2714943 RepID=A0A6G7YNY8_9SPHN|nr:diacylglycerol kinase family protein [Sphingomonas piscis]QIK78451.1 diacylglycerol kinase [Sphingomonas piscis]
MISGDSAAAVSGLEAPAVPSRRPRIALLSNPKSTGNLAQLPRIRAFCAEHPDIFHYEVEKADQIGEALKTIARIRPKVLVINGGDGTVQAALTEIHNGAHFGDAPPPVAVLPSGKTNLIALDLGARGDPISALERLLEIARSELNEHLVAKELIALRHSEAQVPVIGMFLGGAGLADVMLYCRHKIYPLGLPNGISHVITAFAVLMRIFLHLRASFLPPHPSPLQVSSKSERLNGRFSLLAVTTLERLLLSSELGGAHRPGSLKLLAIDERPLSVLRALVATLMGKLGRSKLQGVHFQETDEVQIEGDRSDVILDGETFRAQIGQPIVLRAAQPLSFVRLAA